MEEHGGLLAAGAGLVWRRRRILWWVFAVNFVLGILGTVSAHRTLRATIGHSLIGNIWYKGFDRFTFESELLGHRVNLLRSGNDSVICAVLFFVFMLFVGGGILTTYRDDRKLSSEEFFGASGAFFWRFVRLLVLSVIPLGIIGFLFSALNKLVDYVDERAIADQTSVYVRLSGLLVLGLLLLGVRLWFDVAEVRAVVEGERKMWSNLWRALGITWRSVGRLLWTYLVVVLAVIIVLLIAIMIWSKLPPTAVPATFVLLELMILSQIWGRLWQRASAMVWYKRHAELVPADSVDYTTPAPSEVVDLPPPSVELLPSDPGPELLPEE